MFLPPIEMSDCVTNKQRIEIKEIKTIILAAKIIPGLSHNLLTRDIFKRLSRFSSSILVVSPRKISSSSMSVSPLTM